jgi:hypothetical protein
LIEQAKSSAGARPIVGRRVVDAIEAGVDGDPRRARQRCVVRTRGQRLRAPAPPMVMLEGPRAADRSARPDDIRGIRT